MYPHRSCRIPLPTKQETYVLVSCLTRMNDALPLSYRPEEDNCLGGNRSSKQLSRVVDAQERCLFREQPRDNHKQRSSALVQEYIIALGKGYTGSICYAVKIY